MGSTYNDVDTDSFSGTRIAYYGGAFMYNTDSTEGPGTKIVSPASHTTYDKPAGEAGGGYYYTCGNECCGVNCNGHTYGSYSQSGGQPYGGNATWAHYSSCFSGIGGGGGAATQIVTKTGSTYKVWLDSPGGGGGASSVRKAKHGSCPEGAFAGGGGGGGWHGGDGGGKSGYNGKGGVVQGDNPGQSGSSASGYAGGTISTIFSSNYCNGGDGGVQSGRNTGYDGKSGAIRLTYIDSPTGGGQGGGRGSYQLNKSVSVTGGETLAVLLGNAGNGGMTARIGDNGNNTGTVYYKSAPTNGTATTLYRNNTSGTMLLSSGESTTNLSTGGNHDGLIGGVGGSLKLFNGEVTCTPGTGGTKDHTSGTNASGYGCGGGGGYALGNGGGGSGGYARIAWNKYWDTATNTYKLSQVGAAGSGASGNVLTHSIQVTGNQVIKFRIGRGGNGAYVINNWAATAPKGGDTVFGDLKAGGGGAGGNVGINSATRVLQNGSGGQVSDVCHYKTTSYLSNNKKCIKGTAGSVAVGAEGARGARFAGYSYKIIAKDGAVTQKEVTGIEGEGGRQDTGNNANGKDASGYASGGGGAAIRDIGKVDSSLQSNIVNNQTRGGNGSNGKIIIEYWQ